MFSNNKILSLSLIITILLLALVYFISVDFIHANDEFRNDQIEIFEANLIHDKKYDILFNFKKDKIDNIMGRKRSFWVTKKQLKKLSYQVNEYYEKIGRDLP